MLRLVFKRNDKLCAPGKEAITIRDGMLVDWASMRAPPTLCANQPAYHHEW